MPAHHDRDLTIVNTTESGEQGNGSGSYDPSLSANGRYVSFESFSTNFVPDDTNNTYDVFRKDLRSGELVRVSVASDGEQANGGSISFDISGNGRYVVFSSDATNLVPGDTNGERDVFVKDMRTGGVTLVNTDAEGAVGQGESFLASISRNGRWVAFESEAPNLVPDDSNGTADVFVKDLRTGAVTLVSADAEGNQGTGPVSAYYGASVEPSISADGRWVAFKSFATNLVPDDTNAAPDVFVKDLHSGAILRASTGSDGEQGNGDSSAASISADGHLVAFVSSASNFAPCDDNGTFDVFVKDLRTGALTLVSADPDGHPGNGGSGEPSISPNGRYVAFTSNASNLVEGDDNGHSDVFVRDLQTGRITLVSADPDGRPGDYDSGGSDVANNGDVVFASGATDLVANDANTVSGSNPFDIFYWG